MKVISAAYAVKYENVLPAEFVSKFTVKLLKSHVDNNNHGVVCFFNYANY